MPLDSQSHLLPGLLPARIGGIDFDMPDTSTTVGRRVAEHLFPGLDFAAYDDMGMSPEEINVYGVLLGDDYIQKAQSLRALFKQPGPKQLMHPWLGGLTVILEQPAEISFNNEELRVARFDATFKVISQSGRAATSISTASRLQTAAGKFISSAIKLSSVSSSLDRLVLPRIARLTRSAFENVQPLAIFETMQSAAEDLREYSDRSVVQASPVGAAAGFEPVQFVSPRQLSDRLSKGVVMFFEGISEAPSSTDLAQTISVGALAIGTAADLTLHIQHKSRNDAVKRRSELTELLLQVEISGTELSNIAAAANYASAVSELTRSAATLSAALHDDINEAIGRLPALHTITLERPQDSFLVAHHIYGDDLSRMQTGYEAIVARNDPRHPSQLPAGNIEVER